MRLLVFGSRTFTDMRFVFEKLDTLFEQHDITVVIEGEAKGADSLAREWARTRDIKVLTYPADWKRYGKSAGPVRNVQMLLEGKPDVAVGFIDKPITQSKGSRDMFNKCEAAGVNVTLYHGGLL